MKNEETKGLKSTEFDKENSDLFSGLGSISLKSKIDLRREKNISLTLNNFATIIGASDALKSSTLKGNKIPSPEGSKQNWFQPAKSAIKERYRINSLLAIDVKIHELKAMVPDINKPKSKINIDGSIKALEQFKSQPVVEPFNSCHKQEVKSEVRSIDYQGIAIKVSPNLIFSTVYNGQKVVGAIKLLVRKSNPLNDQQRRVAAFLLRKYLEEKVAKPDEIVLPEFCIFMDVMQQKVTISPNNGEAPLVILRTICDEIEEIWDGISES